MSESTIDTIVEDLYNDKIELREFVQRYLAIEERLETVLKQTGHNFEVLRTLTVQNEHFRDYLELIRKVGTHGTDIDMKEIIRSDEANLANEALEDFE